MNDLDFYLDRVHVTTTGDFLWLDGAEHRVSPGDSVTVTRFVVRRDDEGGWHFNLKAGRSGVVNSVTGNVAGDVNQFGSVANVTIDNGR